MTAPLKARIISMGSYLPEKILSNSALEKMVDTSDEWIVTRCGIRERRLASPEETPAAMGAKAAMLALKRAALKAEDIELIIVATMTPDYLSCSVAALIQHSIGASRACAYDVQAACSGFIYALSAAKAYIESGMYSSILVVAAEKMSSVIDYTDRNTCILFGDGAAAAIVTHAGQGFGLGAWSLGAAGDLNGLLSIPAGGSKLPTSAKTLQQRQHYIKMQGKEIFKHAVRLMTLAAKDCLVKANLTESAISWLIPHQANERIIDAIAKNFPIPREKVFKTLHKYGNTSASAVAIALDELLQKETIDEGEHLLLIAFGAGITWGAFLLTKTR